MWVRRIVQVFDKALPRFRRRGGVPGEQTLKFVDHDEDLLVPKDAQQRKSEICVRSLVELLRQCTDSSSIERRL